MELTNDVLKEYFALSREISVKTKRLSLIKQACKDRGSFMTEEYVCLIDVRMRQGLPGLEEVVKCIQHATLEALALIRSTPVITVKVQARCDYHTDPFVKNF